jgi:hypothetical protein
MKVFSGFFKSTVVGGLLFMVPLSWSAEEPPS